MRIRTRYILSLPERAVRSLVALSGGLLKEIGDIALPAAIRRTVLYRTMVGVTLRFLIEDVGEVEGVYPSEGHLAENFILQRTASHGIELLGILAFRASPVWVLAALADLTGGGQKLIREIVAALKDEGLLDRDAQFETMDQVLSGIEKASGHLALTLNLPPVDVPGLRKEWAILKSELRNIPPSQIRLRKFWNGRMGGFAGHLQQKQNKTPFALSSLIAVSTLSHVPANLLWLSKAARFSGPAHYRGSCGGGNAGALLRHAGGD